MIYILLNTKISYRVNTCNHSHVKNVTISPCFDREMSKAARRREHDESQINVTKYGNLVGLLDEPIPTLRIRDLSIRVVFYPLHFQFHSAHF